MNDYTVRTLSEDCEVLNEEEILVIGEFDPYLSTAFTTQVEAATAAVKRQPEFGSMTVQCFNSDNGGVIWEERIEA